MPIYVYHGSASGLQYDIEGGAAARLIGITANKLASDNIFGRQPIGHTLCLPQCPEVTYKFKTPTPEETGLGRLSRSQYLQYPTSTLQVLRSILTSAVTRTRWFKLMELSLRLLWSQA